MQTLASPVVRRAVHHDNLRWSAEAAADWQARVGWVVGCNFTPSSTINQLEMWQAETFAPETIDRELSWAAGLGFNSVRVFLHDLVWAAEREAYLDRIERFLDMATKHGIGMMPVFFDSVWHPFPRAGVQMRPEPGVHNSGWLQSPGVAVLRDPARFERLGEYVTAVVKRFARDSRIHVWDIWNEPDNPNTHAYGPRDLGEQKAQVVLPLLRQAASWVRSAHPTQPLTTAVWLGDWSSDASLRPIERTQLELSDVISFHNYCPADDLRTRIRQLKRYGRPLLCTEYMARGPGSTFAECLPVLKQEHVGAYCWGFVRGKTQTHLPWDSWQNPYESDPSPWFHDIFHPDGRSYDSSEVNAIRSLTAR